MFDRISEKTGGKFWGGKKGMAGGLLESMSGSGGGGSKRILTRIGVGFRGDWG